MNRLLALAFLTLAITAASGADAQVVLPPKSAVVSCESLTDFAPHITDAVVHVTKAIASAKSGRQICVVDGKIAPAIQFEVRLPVDGWTQRYLQIGCGGLCGSLSIRVPQRPCPMADRGDFVMASTDMGHQNFGGSFGADPQKRIDFAYRGVHLTAVVAKAVIRKFYGQNPKWSYFSGCSDGGREALMEAQRFPGDFDGIAAGAPAFNFLVQNSFHHGWSSRSQSLGGLTATDLQILHAAAIASCDALDGVKDGVISNPLACHFDPLTIVCKNADQTNCLSLAKATEAADLYHGARDEDGGRLEIGGYMPGSELQWAGVAVPGRPGAPAMAAMFASDTIKWLAYAQPVASSWQLSDFQFTKETMSTLLPMHGLYDATDPDIRAFAKKGGRLLVWHGWSDQHINPVNSIAYWQAVRDTIGAAQADKVMRLFVVPGLYHCQGGEGPSSVDVLTPLMQWVEQGTVPASLVASTDAKAAAQGQGRPVFPFPATSELTQGADPSVAASWHPGAAIIVPDKIYANWDGAMLFKPDYEKVCTAQDGKLVCHSLH